MEIQTEHQPTDTEGHRILAADREQHQAAVAIGDRSQIVWKLSGRRGRREVRQQLLEGKLDFSLAEVNTTFDRHHGVMAGTEALRNKALNVLWPILQLVASGELPLESFKSLWMEETDT